MKILMAASEATPFAKTGGLADVLGALPVSLQARGEEVAVALPMYRSASPHLKDSERVYDGLAVTLGNTTWVCSIRRLIHRGLPFFFVDCPALYDRDRLYGEAGVDYSDNHIRFGVFAHAVLAIMRGIFRPDVIHCHDWQASLIAALIATKFRLDPTFYGIKRLLTIHNLGYQGLFPKTAVRELGLSQSVMHPSSMEFFGQLNLLKGGIVYSHAINTVSQGYAREIQTEEYGFGLDGLLRSRARDLSGIVNGVDYEEWSPEKDRYIATAYNTDDVSAKQICKRDLLETFGLPATHLKRPVIGIVSRFATQKGFDLIEEIADQLAREDISLTVIGTGEPRYEEMFRRLAETYPDKIAVRVTYSDELSHKIEAGSDMFLMPSRYEPCGLNQIYSLRYGTLPIVRATGGLDDTINERNGFKFREYSGPALLAAIRSALQAFKNPERWQELVRNAMQCDFSWNASAAEYSALYRRMAG
ncbi:MAG TPA: glycogen synthase GlgA [Bryobacteraceae bacterium]|nr:glycogen synthase GlgA [Bryobacteraceae bacterium]